MMEFFQGPQLKNTLGASFARFFIRLVQHNPPASLAELQAELGEESAPGRTDFRAAPEFLKHGLAESGMEGYTYVRSVGEAEVPLVEGGQGKEVTDENKGEWLEKLLWSEMVESCADAAKHFRKGFMDVVGFASTYDHVDDPEICRWTTPHFFMLTADELRTQWSGAPVSPAFVDELQANAIVQKDVKEQAGWLWDIMRDLDDHQRAKYYRFMTGSSRRPAGKAPTIEIGPKEGDASAGLEVEGRGEPLSMPSC
uniref:HECT-type E3 ubiquitin transferase n=2 Tax=Haptolina ericina TaxID=156174 RepID=A0A7S3BEZ3_9EUKA|mmetsp:Transcript_58203/g.129755  ORF Transcript_58203/g.129755 Transcript_58203/m.129755 type:complete len:254 (+) Transcript_58203:264-1025(+)